METVVNGKQEAAAAGASQPSLLVRRLKTAISVLLVGVALAAPAWTKAAVLLFRVALLLWLLRMLTPPRPRLRPLAIAKPLLLYILLAAFSCFFSLEPALSWARMRTVSLFLLALLVAANLNEERWLKRLIAALLASSLFTAAFTAWRYLAARPAFAAPPLRAEGFFGNYIPFSELLMLVAAFAWGLFMAALISRQRKQATWLLVTLLPIAAVLITTGTRAATAALVLAIVITIWLRSAWRWRVMAAAAAVLIIALGSVWYRYQRHGQGWLSVNDPGTQYRLLMWQDGVRLALQHPLTGIGMDSVERHGRELGIRAYERYPKLKSHFHSTPVQIAAESGVLALAAWIWLMTACFAAPLALLRTDSQPGVFVRGCALGSLAALVAFNAISLVHYIAGDAEVMIVFWLLAGVAFSLQPNATAGAAA